MSPEATTEAIDPVCGMTVETSTDLRTDYHGTTYYFCHPSCLAKFTEAPAHYLEKASSTPSEADLQAVYTCPMHPEVRQKGPGACPFCGMGLEPVAISADAGPSTELVDMTRRFWIGLTLA